MNERLQRCYSYVWSDEASITESKWPNFPKHCMCLFLVFFYAINEHQHPYEYI